MQGDRFDLAVVGAGLSGSLLALAAGEAGLDTVLIDRVPLKSLTDAGFDGRTTAIAYTSQRLFAALGVWPELAGQAGLLSPRAVDRHRELLTAMGLPTTSSDALVRGLCMLPGLRVSPAGNV